VSDRELTPQAVRDRERVQRLKPKEDDFKGKKGYERYHVVEVGGQRVKVQGEAPDGSYKWAYHFKPNDHGKLTREAAEVGEMLRPFQRADIERVENMPPSAALAESTERSRGRSRTHVTGSPVECRAGGRWCLTTPYPWTPVPEGGLPDGTWA